MTKKIASHHAPHTRTVSERVPACVLCRTVGGTVLWRDSDCRVVLIRDADYPGYCRVIWNTHVKEMTDLPPLRRAHCMRVVFAVESAVREVFRPDKVNLAAFGNMAPHLHWHVIPRFTQDAHFPNPVWGARRDTGALATLPRPPAKWRTMLAQTLSRLL